jgi:hypothetical protein
VVLLLLLNFNPFHELARVLALLLNTLVMHWSAVLFPIDYVLPVGLISLLLVLGI